MSLEKSLGSLKSHGKFNFMSISIEKTYLETKY